MPLVPGYDNFTAAPGALPGVRFSAPDLPDPNSAQQLKLGAALTSAGDAVGRSVQQVLQDTNDLQVNAAMNSAVAESLHLRYHKTEGFSGVLGEAALKPDAQGKSLEESYQSKLDAKISSIAAGLGNDAQRRVFAAHVGRVRSQFSASLQSHLVQEYQSFEAAERKKGMLLAQTKGALGWDDSQVLADSRATIIRAVASDASLGPNERAAQTLENLSPLHSAVVATAIEKNNLDYARQYLGQFNQEMTADARLRLQKVLDVGTSRAKVQTFGDSIIEQKLPMEEALKLAREGFTGLERDQAVKEVHDRYQEANIAQTNQINGLAKGAWTSIMAHGRLSSAQVAELTEKAPEELRKIRDWQDQKRRQAKAEAEGGSAAKEGTYYGLRRLAMDDSQAFEKLDLMKFEPYLTKNDFRHLVEVQALIGSGEAKALETNRVLKLTTEAIKYEVAAIGIDLTPTPGRPVSKETALFMDALTRGLDEATKAKGAALTADEAKRVGMGMVREGIEQGSGVFGLFATKKRGYQIATDPNIKPDASFVAKRFDDIPSAARQSLVNDYRARNSLGAGPMTDSQKAEIERAYTRGLQLGRF